MTRSSTGIVVIRPMKADDLPAVVEVERICSAQPWTLGMFTDELQDREKRSYLVAEAGSVVVGFSGLLVQVGEGHITNIAVLPELRRKGTGAQLLLASIRTAIARRATAMTLEVRVSNVGARALYQRFGFAPAGVRPKYYLDNQEDALIMWAHDIDTSAYGLRLASITEWLERRSQSGGEA